MADSKTVTMRMPSPVPMDQGRENPLANLDFGPYGPHEEGHATGNIKFQQDGNVGYATVRADHPLLPDLLRKYPQIEFVTGAQPTIYLCSICDDGREFASKPALRMHMRVHKDPDEE